MTLQGKSVLPLSRMSRSSSLLLSSYSKIWKLLTPKFFRTSFWSAGELQRKTCENTCPFLTSFYTHSRYVHRLPLMFIFGIATSPSTIQHMLPHSVSSLLCIQLFQSLSCTEHLATVIDKVEISSLKTHSNKWCFLCFLTSSRDIFLHDAWQI